VAASVTDKFRKGAAAFSTTLAAQKAAGAASCSLSSATGLPTDTGVDITVGRVDSSGTRTPSAKAVYKGTISGTTVSNLTLVEGTDQLHAAGTVVEVTFTAATWNDAMTGILTQHNQDGTHGAVTATSVTATGAVSGATVAGSTSVSDAGTTLQTYRSDVLFDHVASGIVWTGDAYASTRNASMTAGVIYIGGQRVSVSAVSARAFTASKDTYVDIGTDGVVDYNEVANNAASPALAASHIRVAIIVTGASNIANVGSINQGQEDKVLPIASSVPYAVTDSLGNLICPRDPSRRVLGYRQINAQITTTSTSNVQATGLSTPIIIPSGRRARATAYLVGIGNTTSGQAAAVNIWNGAVGVGTQLQEVAYTSTGAGTQIPVTLAAPITSSGSITVNIGYRASANTAAIGAGASAPSILVVELV
jgi:hypothetical protein